MHGVGGTTYTRSPPICIHTNAHAAINPYNTQLYTAIITTPPQRSVACHSQCAHSWFFYPRLVHAASPASALRFTMTSTTTRRRRRAYAGSRRCRRRRCCDGVRDAVRRISPVDRCTTEPADGGLGVAADCSVVSGCVNVRLGVRVTTQNNARVREGGKEDAANG